MLDHDLLSYQDIARAFVGEPVGSLTREEILDNITLTWLPSATHVDRTGVPQPRLFNELDRGNHFAAWQEPGLFTSEVRAAFRSLR